MNASFSPDLNDFALGASIAGSGDLGCGGAFTYTNTPYLSGSSQSGYSHVQFLIGVSGQF